MIAFFLFATGLVTAIVVAAIFITLSISTDDSYVIWLSLLLTVGFSIAILVLRRTPLLVLAMVAASLVIGSRAYATADHNGLPLLFLVLCALAVVGYFALAKKDAVLFEQMQGVLALIFTRSAHAWALGVMAGSLLATAYLWISGWSSHLCYAPKLSWDVGLQFFDVCVWHGSDPSAYVRANGAIAKWQQENGTVAHWRSDLPPAFALFLTTLFTFLGIGALYRRIAPITSLKELLLDLEDDLRKAVQTGATLWFSFPGLALGGYRSFDERGLENEMYPVFERYRAALNDAILSKRVRCYAISYPWPLLQEFYRYYDTLNSPSGGSPIRVQKVLRVEENLLHTFDSYNDQHFEVAPHLFPAHVIVVGDIVYSISTFGLPMYEPAADDAFVGGRFSGKFVGGEHALADLMVFRRQDSIFADRVRQHLHQVVQQYAKLTKPPSEAQPTQGK